MKKLKTKLSNALNNQRGQGATEYILLLVVVVALVLVFKDRIKTAVADKMGELQGNIGGFQGE